jgi:hypothetical protein
MRTLADLIERLRDETTVSPATPRSVRQIEPWKSTSAERTRHRG